jgi:hypothetical protein
VYRPLVDRKLIEEYENNNYKIPERSRLRDICRNELRDKRYIEWDNVDWGA